MRYIYSQCHFAKEQHERRDAVKRQFVPVVSGGNPAAGAATDCMAIANCNSVLSALMVITGLKII